MTGNLQNLVIMMADDDADDRYLVHEAWQELNIDKDLHFVSDGHELMESLEKGINGQDQDNILPNLILLDLNMPRKSGQKALQEIKANPKLKHIPVVVLTTSKDDDDILSCYQIGAAGFITKPTSYQDLLSTIKDLYVYWFEIVTLPKRN
jgi:CheY-like chemotaxis protein